jgi:hypothetical protein
MDFALVFGDTPSLVVREFGLGMKAGGFGCGAGIIFLHFLFLLCSICHKGVGRDMACRWQGTGSEGDLYGYNGCL